MGLNVAKGNMYEFVTHTWNTIKGACPHDCSYCYMKRFGNLKPARLDAKELKTDLGDDNFIFVGSSCDMFAGEIPSEWIEKTLSHCRERENKYLFQSKNPAGFSSFYPHGFPSHTNLCTTIESNRFYSKIMCRSPTPQDRASAMQALNDWNYRFDTFVTIEPILDFDLTPLVELIRRCEPEQVNIGADSGGNNLPEPSIEKVMELVAELGKFTRVAKKRNLTRLDKTGGNL